MGFDLIGASLTTSEVKDASNRISMIATYIEGVMKSVDNTMTTLTGQSEGGLIEKTTTAVEQLTELIVTVIECIHKISNAIMSYLEDMLDYDQRAKELLLNSTGM